MAEEIVPCSQQKKKEKKSEQKEITAVENDRSRSAAPREHINICSGLCVWLQCPFAAALSCNSSKSGEAADTSFTGLPPGSGPDQMSRPGYGNVSTGGGIAVKASGSSHVATWRAPALGEARPESVSPLCYINSEHH